MLFSSRVIYRHFLLQFSFYRLHDFLTFLFLFSFYFTCSTFWIHLKLFASLYIFAATSLLLLVFISLATANKSNRIGRPNVISEKKYALRCYSTTVIVILVFLISFPFPFVSLSGVRQSEFIYEWVFVSVYFYSLETFWRQRILVDAAGGGTTRRERQMKSVSLVAIETNWFRLFLFVFGLNCLCIVVISCNYIRGVA